MSRARRDPGGRDINRHDRGTALKPSTIAIAVGDTVSLTSLDGRAHTVTSNTGIWESGTIRGGGGQFTRFSAAGRFEYFCQLLA